MGTRSMHSTFLVVRIYRVLPWENCVCVLLACLSTHLFFRQGSCNKNSYNDRMFRPRRSSSKGTDRWMKYVGTEMGG